MSQFIPLIVGLVALVIGSTLGYYARQSIARKQVGTLEERIQKRITQVKAETEVLVSQSKEKARKIIELAEREERERRDELLKTERLLLRRENILDEKISNFEHKERDFQEKLTRLKEIKENLESLKKEALENLERISKLSKEEAKKEVLESVEKNIRKKLLRK